MTKAEKTRMRILNGGRGAGENYRRLFEYYENKVAGLKAENEKLNNRCKKYEQQISAMESGTCTVCSEVDKELQIEKLKKEQKEKIKTACIKSIRHFANVLKDYDRTQGAWTDYFEHTVDKVLEEELGLYQEQ